MGSQSLRGYDPIAAAVQSDRCHRFMKYSGYLALLMTHNVAPIEAIPYMPVTLYPLGSDAKGIFRQDTLMATSISHTKTISIISAALSFSLLLCGCGGGGGDGSSGTYQGTWGFVGTKLTDTCRSSLGNNIGATLIVSQNGSAVTVQSGSLTLTGSVNDKDGFDASLIRPGDDGCTQGVSVGLRDASDGTAIAAYALAVQCRGVTCAVGYGGTATRTSTKSLEADTEDRTVESMTNTLSEVTATSKTGIEGGLLNALEETQMEIERQQGE